MPYRLLVMINQGGERICTGLAEKGQAYPFKFPLSLYQKFEIQSEYGGEVEHLGRCELNTFVAVN